MQFIAHRVVFLLGCIDGHLSHPIAQDVLWVVASHGLKVGFPVHSFPPMSEPGIPLGLISRCKIIERFIEWLDAWFIQSNKETEEEGHVNLVCPEEIQQFVDEFLVRFLQVAQSEFGRPGFALEIHREFRDMFEHRLQEANVLHQWRHGFQQPCHVPRTDVRLLSKSIAPTLGIGGVGCPINVERLQPSVRAVIDGDSMDRHVVRVHHTVDETNAHPMSDHGCRTLSNFGQPGDKTLIGITMVRGKMMTNRVVDQGPQRIVVSVRHVDLKTPKTNETWSNTANHGPGFRGWVPVVQHVANHLFTG